MKMNNLRHELAPVNVEHIIKNSCKKSWYVGSSLYIIAQISFLLLFGLVGWLGFSSRSELSLYIWAGSILVIVVVLTVIGIISIVKVPANIKKFLTDYNKLVNVLNNSCFDKLSHRDMMEYLSNYKEESEEKREKAPWYTVVSIIISVITLLFTIAKPILEGTLSEETKENIFKILADEDLKLRFTCLIIATLLFFFTRNFGKMFSDSINSWKENLEEYKSMKYLMSYVEAEHERRLQEVKKKTSADSYIDKLFKKFGVRR